MPEAHLITTDQEFHALEPLWYELLVNSDHQSPFMSWEWVSCWWKYFGSGQLHVITFQESNELVGIAPLYCTREPWGIRSLRILGTGLSDYMDFLIREGYGQTLYRTLLECVLTEDSFELISLEQVPPNRLETLKEISRSSGFYLQIKPRGHCYGVRLPASWDEYLQGLGKKERYNIRRQSHILENRHQVIFKRIHQPGEELGKAIEEFFGLMMKRLMMRERHLAVREQTLLRFHQDVAERFAGRGWLNLCMLERNSRPIASLLTFEYARKLFYYHSGFDPEWAKYSVGTVLLAKCVEDGIERGIREFDFMRGHAAYKSKWKVDERIFYRVAIGRNLVSYLKVLASGLTVRTEKLLARLLG